MECLPVHSLILKLNREVIRLLMLTRKFNFELIDKSQSQNLFKSGPLPSRTFANFSFLEMKSLNVQ